MTPDKKSLASLRDELARKRAFSKTGNKNSSKEDWNVEADFKAGFDAAQAHYEKILGVAEDLVKSQEALAEIRKLRGTSEYIPRMD